TSRWRPPQAGATSPPTWTTGSSTGTSTTGITRTRTTASYMRWRPGIEPGRSAGGRRLPQWGWGRRQQPLRPHRLEEHLARVGRWLPADLRLELLVGDHPRVADEVQVAGRRLHAGRVECPRDR